MYDVGKICGSIEFCLYQPLDIDDLIDGLFTPGNRSQNISVTGDTRTRINVGWNRIQCVDTSYSSYILIEEDTLCWWEIVDVQEVSPTLTVSTISVKIVSISPPPI